MKEPVFGDFQKNKLRVITFNYDRSLEHFLFTSLKESYDKKDEDCAEVLSKIPIIHVYGSLGRLHWQPGSGSIVPYGFENRIEHIKKASENIMLLDRDGTWTGGFDRAHEVLHDAKRIYFLGFGFNPTNLERLEMEPPQLLKEIGEKLLSVYQIAFPNHISLAKAKEAIDVISEAAYEQRFGDIGYKRLFVQGITRAFNAIRHKPDVEIDKEFAMRMIEGGTI